jgi:hypothetical protein
MGLPPGTGPTSWGTRLLQAALALLDAGGFELIDEGEYVPLKA